MGNENKEQLALEALQRGLSDTDVRLQTGLGNALIRRVRRTHNIPFPKNSRVFTEEDEQKVVAELRKGKINYVLAREIGCSAKTVSLLRAKYQIPHPTRPGSSVTPKLEAEIKNALVHGFADKEAAEQFGVNAKHVTNLRKKYSIPRHLYNITKITPEIRTQVADEFRSGVTPAQIAKKMGISQSTVYPILRRAGFKTSRETLVERKLAMRPILEKARAEGATTLREISKWLNKNNVPVLWNARAWHSATVLEVDLFLHQWDMNHNAER